MRFKTLYLAAVMLLAALQVVHADTYSNVYTLADVTQGNEGEVVDPSLNKEWEPGIDWHTMQIGSGASTSATTRTPPTSPSPPTAPNLPTPTCGEWTSPISS